MKLWTNFDMFFYDKACRHNRRIYWENFIISRFHIILYFSIVMFYVCLSLWLIIALLVIKFYYSKVIYADYFVSLIEIVILLCIVKILYEYVKFINSFVVINKNEVVIYHQQSILDRRANIMPMTNIRNFLVRNSSVLYAIFGYGSLEICTENKEQNIVLDFFPRIQKAQFKIRDFMKIPHSK